ncbi:LacI family DNA-binding transcriptional regulator [Listeria seeligeri]|uniref:LacI family DNA-binding transcriptional regulator n=1 Tax=Listeria seeligeri TaxID=1640 RepID=UPI0010DD04FF|nr:LacI family DNA-binding transcriptional regulator [Listeria seeligeri]MBC1424110.1 LacI family transcriptional regulator [Listeria seeligeri]MBC1429116.1 LacI family transcriptional regulator [Listeria seeligeri]MBC1444794.1 LacI family transcriptional regulator [Listeria seeligeri]MBC1480412.1 LacI family transcriptional regulator [Listeria seeligeri]MBC1527090.1 LacI family transcriptional regulator [Listeria seeligeri]
MVTIKDIAKDTGFSVTTVSRALNGYSDVNEETRAIIRASAQKLQYSPNMLAQSLVTKKSKIIGLLVTDLKRESVKDNFVFEVLCGVSEYVTTVDYEMILISTTTSRQRNKTFSQVVGERNLDGVIIQGLKKDDPYLTEAVASDLPTVLIDIPIENSTTGYVTSDQVDSVKTVIKYLSRLGHKKIAFMNGHKHAYVSEIRFKAYQESLSEIGIPYDDNLLFYGDFEEEKAYQTAFNFLLARQEVSAIFCASDIMALGVLQAARELRIRVPEDLSIIGFDNILLTRYVSPSISTVAQNPFELGTVASKLVLDIINQKSSEHHQILKNKLIIRESSGPSN